MSNYDLLLTVYDNGKKKIVIEEYKCIPLDDFELLYGNENRKIVSVDLKMRGENNG